MKRLFFSVIALALASFAFTSCNDDDKVENEKEGRDGVKYLTLTQQQQAIQASLEGVAEAIQFTDLSTAMEAVYGLLGRNFTSSDLSEILLSPEVVEDSLFQMKFYTALALFARDTVVLDLTPFYMSADLLVTDTMITEVSRSLDSLGNVISTVDTVYKSMLSLANINHDFNGLQLTLLADGHEIVLKADSKVGENMVSVSDENESKTYVLPQSGEFSVTIDGRNVFASKGQLKSDMNLFVQKKASETDKDDFVITGIEANGTKATISDNINVTGYEMDGFFDYEMSRGMNGRMVLSYAGHELLSASGKVDAIFDDLNLNDTVSILTWAQNPDLLKSINLNASLGKGKISMDCSVDNPCKDKDLAMTLFSLTQPGVVLKEAKAKEVIDKLNGFLNAGIYFEGFEEPQAKFIFVYDEPGDAGKDVNAPVDEEDNEIVKAIKDEFRKISEVFRNNGINTVFVVRDDNGKEITVPVENYFRGIDLSKVQQVLYEKLYESFAPLLEIINNALQESGFVEEEEDNGGHLLGRVV